MLAKARKLQESSGKKNVEFVESRITQIALPSGIADCIISNCVVNLVPEQEKQLVFNEMYRLLKPGGRIAISDILARKPLPDNIRQNMSLYVGCIAGASQVAAYEEYLSSAGFTGTLTLPPQSGDLVRNDSSPVRVEVMITDAGADLNVYNQAGEASCCGTADGNKADSCCAPVKEMVKDLQGQDMNQWAGKQTSWKTPKYSSCISDGGCACKGSFRIYAVKR